MKKIFFILCFFSTVAVAQNSLTFEIEELERPQRKLFLTDNNSIYQKFILSESKLEWSDLKKAKTPFDYGIIAKGNIPDSLVSFYQNNNPFFYGMYQAYADHRPFVLSPDMIWLLISQGFAHHVRHNAETLRSKFVDFDGESSLVVTSDEVKINLESSAEEWEKLFPFFTKKIAAHTGNKLVDILTADFTTSTPTTKVASQITIMKAMEAYFEYVYIYLVCGIPEITLEGTPEDWKKVLQKAHYLKKYDLKWWIDEIEPLLKEIVKTSEGQIDKVFWRNMFKYHTLKEYGAPKVIDGWIVKFFPYDNDGNRNNLKTLTTKSKLPSEMLNVDLKYIALGNGEDEIILLELWAGFVGLQQNKKTLALRPEINWMIRRKTNIADLFEKKFEERVNNSSSLRGGLKLRVSVVPKELLKVKNIKELTLQFIDKIKIPEALSSVNIEILNVDGEIDQSGEERLIRLFPNTQLFINGKGYGLAKGKTEP